MPRVHLEMPTYFKHTCELTVRASDLNYGGHVGNDSILTIMQEARILFYQSMGYKNELNFEGAVGHIIADATVVYKSEGFLGDVWTIEIGTSEFSKYGFDMFYRISNKKSGKEVALGKTGIVFFDYDKRKVAAVPLTFAEKVNAVR
jgi:acyl-CoA thioester hydrolase